MYFSATLQNQVQNLQNEDSVLFSEIEKCIEDGDLEKIKEIYEKLHVNFEYGSGSLGTLAVKNVKVLEFMCEKSKLIQNYGEEMLIAAVWGSRIDAVRYLDSKGINLENYKNTNVYSYYTDLLNMDKRM